MYRSLLKVCSTLPETALWARGAIAARSKKAKPAADGVLATKVRKGHDFDGPKLYCYLRSELGAGVLPASDSDIELKQFSWGQSNPTFALRWKGGTEGLVVRKQPPGKLLKGAHDVGRDVCQSTCESWREASGLDCHPIANNEASLLAEYDHKSLTPDAMAKYYAASAAAMSGGGAAGALQP